MRGADGVLARQAEMHENGGEFYGTEMFENGLAYQEQYTWVESLGITYHVGVDGLNAPMVLLTGMVAVAGVLISWRIEQQLREFMAVFLAFGSGCSRCVCLDRHVPAILLLMNWLSSPCIC